MKIDTLDALLQQREDAYNRVLPKSYETEKPSYPPTTAVKSATLDSFMEMIGMLVAKTMKKTKAEFVPDEGARIEVDMAVPIDHPRIYYEVISRKPKSELKPRPREEIHELTADDGSRRQGRVWGQKFECHVQFHIAASDYKQANKVMNDFESLIFNYTAFFKKNGVAEILSKNILLTVIWIRSGKACLSAHSSTMSRSNVSSLSLWHRILRKSRLVN